MAGAVVTHYEVYALDSQRWVLHARFHGSEKDEAVEEAKRVERTVGIAAKVTREVYHPGNNTAEEQVVYISDKSLRDASARKTLAPARPGPGGGLRGGAAMPGNGGMALAGVDSPALSPAAKRTKTAESMGVVLKLTIVISVALVIAGTVTGIVSAVLEKYPEYSVQMSDSAISLLMFSSFVVSFLITAVPLAMTLINWQGVGKGSRRREPERSPLRAAPPKPRKVAPVAPPSLEDVAPLLPDDAELVIADDTLPPDFTAEDPLESGFEAIPDLPIAEELSAEDVLTKEPVKDAATLHAEMLEALKTQAMQFLSGLLATIRAKRPQLDAYNKFGLDLMLAGGVELLATQKHLDGGEKRKLLASVIESMGTKPETAKAFTEKVEDYLVEPRYVAMIQAGRSVMENFLVGSDSSDQLVGIALESWNKPQGQQAAPKIITVMFTDMVGSTDMTQAQGDEAAQTVVRRHNTIVRAALAQFAGKEVKHTGDGIMASFVSAANGVEAAASIQKAVASHNAKHPDQPLHLRIGMNAGEPIEEEDDLFGTTVQLAARVCAKADADQVFCTNVVRELSSGKKIDFTSLGAHSLKGFRDPIELYEVSWKPRKKA